MTTLVLPSSRLPDQCYGVKSINSQNSEERAAAYLSKNAESTLASVQHQISLHMGTANSHHNQLRVHLTERGMTPTVSYNTRTSNVMNIGLSALSVQLSIERFRAGKGLEA